MPFALYHGSSSHYLVNFRPGESLTRWPYQRDALKLYRRVWIELKRLGQAPDWWKGKNWTRHPGTRTGSTASSI